MIFKLIRLVGEDIRVFRAERKGEGKYILTKMDAVLPRFDFLKHATFSVLKFLAAPARSFSAPVYLCCERIQS